MKRVLIAVGVIAALLVPLTAAAKVTKTDRHNARTECKALRKAAGKKNFAALMHTSKRKAYGRCVKRKSREEAKERDASHTNAAKACKAERSDASFADTHGGKSFNEFYGTNKNGHNAYGKCVSQKARAKKEEMDQADTDRINAAKACRTEQKDAGFAGDHGGKSFAEFYGTNHNNRNAFGKCVSGKAKAMHDEDGSSS